MDSKAERVMQSYYRVFATAATGVGFMNDARRLNVALTRAKTFLWILCSANTSSNPLWASLINDALHRDVVVPQITVEEFLHASKP